MDLFLFEMILAILIHYAKPFFNDQ